MIEFTSKNIRYLSHLGARGVLGQVMLDMAQEGKLFYAMSADLAVASGFERLRKEFPEKCINTGIAEQAMIGVASGLAKTGIPIFATSWAVFASLRITDQIRNYMGNMQANIKLIGMDSGLTHSDFGISHTNPQDISVFRAQPGVQVIAPSDGQMLYKLLYEIQQNDKPTYVRMTGGSRLPIIYKENQEIKIGEAIYVREGKDIAFISTGTIIAEVLKCADILEKEGIECAVIDINTIKPFDYSCVEKSLSKRLIVTVEEHSFIGGLGGIVAEYLSQYTVHPRLLICGVQDRIIDEMEYSEALKENELDSNGLAEKVRKAIQE